MMAVKIKKDDIYEIKRKGKGGGKGGEAFGEGEQGK